MSWIERLLTYVCSVLKVFSLKKFYLVALKMKPVSLPSDKNCSKITNIYKLQRRIAIAYVDKNKRLWSKLQNQFVSNIRHLYLKNDDKKTWRQFSFGWI